MTRARTLLALGLVLLLALLVQQGWEAWLKVARMAGLGLILVVLFHAIPLLLDASALRVLFGRGRGSLRDAIFARWVGESANSLLPGGQIGGPVLMARQLARRGVPASDALAVVTVGMTFQTLALLGFALLGLMLLAAHAESAGRPAVRSASFAAGAVLALLVVLFYSAQRRGMFSRLVGLMGRWLTPKQREDWMVEGESVDRKISSLYGRPAATGASFGLSLFGWVAGVGEVYLAVRLLGHPLSWSNSLLMESLGQTIRSTAFAVPAALGVQEGGYVLLASLVGLPPASGLALALVKRLREVALGAPGLWYLHHQSGRAVPGAPPSAASS
jgi:putative membrane protein